MDSGAVDSVTAGPSATARAEDPFAAVRAVADSILYEGYLLYPYRRSSGKNRVRWQFGVLVPAGWATAHGLVDTGVAGSAESSWQQTECLLEAGDDATVRLQLRFLHLRHKTVQRRRADGGYRPVDRLRVAGTEHLSFDEALPCAVDVRARVADLLRGEHRVDIDQPGGDETEPLHDGPDPVGRLVRRRWPVTASVRLSAARCDTPFRLVKLRVRVDNTDRSTPPDAPRDLALRRSLLATHTLLAGDGRYLSLLDPPEWAAGAAADCRNVHTFPVLAGGPDDRHLVLSSPIILYDHPRVAPESPGDLHDATEIDEILSLRTLTLSDTEKREVRATDRRAAAILDRIETMPPEALDKLHGALQSLHRAGGSRTPGGPGAPGGPQEPPDAAALAAGDAPTAGWGTGGATAGWGPDDEAGADDPTGRGVLVAGVRLGRGSRVRLRPRVRGTDAHDMFLAGRTARVHEVLVDVDGSRFLAVTVDDDPGAQLHQWYGRLRHFRPDEVEPLADTTSGDPLADGGDTPPDDSDPATTGPAGSLTAGTGPTR